MFRPLIHDRRGVSEVVASLLMILIVSVAGTALYSYSMNTFSSSWSSFNLQTKVRGERAQERFSVIAVWSDDASLLNLTILNHGKIELAIDAVYVDGTKVTINEGRGTVVGTKGKVQVKFTLTGLVQGETYEIIVVSERGSRDVVYWKA